MVDGLGKLIVGRRKELGYSQQDLARMIGVPAANLSQLEHSPSRWRSRLIPALADALGVSQLELIMAARVISDLPPFPSPGAAEELRDPYLPTFEVNGRADQAKERFRLLSDELTEDEIDFLLAVAETFSRRGSDRDRMTTTVIAANHRDAIESAT
jgi:transcriptional regulator with XRE-family HTH domain